VRSLENSLMVLLTRCCTIMCCAIQQPSISERYLREKRKEKGVVIYRREHISTQASKPPTSVMLGKVARVKRTRVLTI